MPTSRFASSTEGPLARRACLARVASLGLGPWLGAGASAQTASPAATGAATVWVVLAENSAIHRETATALQDELRDEGLLWRLVPGSGVAALLTSATALPGLIVTIGAQPYRDTLAAMGGRSDAASIPLMATLLPQAAFDRLDGHKPAQISAVVLDQPPSRFMELIRAGWPDVRRVGVLMQGAAGPAALAALDRAAAERGLSLVRAEPSAGAPTEDVFAAARRVLDRSELLLLQPDAEVTAPGMLQNVLIAAYRQRQPVVSFSAAQVRAGATVGLFTRADQVAQQTAAALRNWWRRRVWPAPAAALDFEVQVNEPVARSLGLLLPSATALAEAVRRREARR